MDCILCGEPASAEHFAFAGNTPRYYFCDDHWAERGESWWLETIPWENYVVLRERGTEFPACPVRFTYVHGY